MNKIKHLRQEKGITQEELGKVLNVQKAAISKYELERATPSTDVLKRMATYFNVSIDYLLDYTPPTQTVYTNPSPLSPNEQKLLNAYRQLNDFGKRQAQRSLLGLTQDPDCTTITQENSVG